MRHYEQNWGFMKRNANCLSTVYVALLGDKISFINKEEDKDSIQHSKMPSGTFWTVKLLDGCEVGIDCCSMDTYTWGSLNWRNIFKYPGIAFLGDLQVQNRTLIGIDYFIHQRRHQKKFSKWRQHLQSLPWNRSLQKEVSLMWWASLQLVITNQNNLYITNLTGVTSN